jgi:DNA-binding transcriptional LysR family regulator
MDRLQAMNVLLAVVETGSLSAASRRLKIPLATVSRRVAELEAHLGAKLLNRTSRTLGLTDAGRDYVAAARRILDDVAEAERTAAGEYAAPKGDLIITAPLVFGRLHVLPVVVEFLKAYREVDIRLVLNDRIVSLAEDHVDLAVRIGELPDSSLVALRVGSISRVVCASPAYLAARGEPGIPAELTGHDCITFDNLGLAERWSFPHAGSEVAVAIHSRLSVNTAEAALDAATAGVGITRVLSYQAAAALSDGRLQRLLGNYQPAPAPVHLVHSGGRMLPRKLRTFLEFAGPRLKAALEAVQAQVQDIKASTGRRSPRSPGR